MSEKNGDFLKGLFIGGVIGIAIGILFAPKSGKETRDDISSKTTDLLSKAKDEYEKITGKNELAGESSSSDLKELTAPESEKSEDTEIKTGEQGVQNSEPAQMNKNIFKKAIDAGLAAYRAECNKE